MSTAELIFEKAKALPEALQTEALLFLDFLLSRKEAKKEASDWPKFAAAQLENQYGPSDEIYDND